MIRGNRREYVSYLLFRNQHRLLTLAFVSIAAMEAIHYHGSAAFAFIEQNRMKTSQHGFTLIEMLAVIAIIGILASVAIPSYMERIVRQQIEAALPLADIAKKPIAESWALLHTFPDDNATALLPAPEKIVSNFVSSLSIKNGAIQITFGNRASSAITGKILSLRPAVVTDAPVVPVAWVCGNAKGPDAMSIQGINQTNVPNTFLPGACR